MPPKQMRHNILGDQISVSVRGVTMFKDRVPESNRRDTALHGRRLEAPCLVLAHFAAAEKVVPRQPPSINANTLSASMLRLYIHHALHI
jgi:hypothetical protein